MLAYSGNLLKAPLWPNIGVIFIIMLSVLGKKMQVLSGTGLSIELFDFAY